MQIGKETNAYALRALALVHQALPVKLTEPQGSQALNQVLNQIGQETDPQLAEALQALSAKLTDAQAMQASTVAAASLAWADTDYDAAEWARALVRLSVQAADRDDVFVKAIAYRAAAGSATDVLLDAIRAGHPDAPAKEAGTEAALAWLAKTFPNVLRPPLCPPPLQPELEMSATGNLTASAMTGAHPRPRAAPRRRLGQPPVARFHRLHEPLRGAVRLGKAFEAVDHGDENVVDAARLAFVDDLEPELGPLGLLDPEPEDLLLAVRSEATPSGRAGSKRSPRARR